MPDDEREITERLLVEAGLVAGMRVLDVGCGRGEVSFLLARLVGEHGAVVGVDRDGHWLAVARERARESGFDNVTFVEADMTALPEDLGAFDAAVGRRVLMYQSDAVHAVRRLAEAVRPGGLVFFQEHDTTMVPASAVSLPLHRRVHEWMWRTVERERANLHMGFDLHAVLEAAGLVVERVRAEAIVQTPKARRATATIIRYMLPRIVAEGVASEAEIDIETLDARLQAELEEANATYVGDFIFAAWARKPPSV